MKKLLMIVLLAIMLAGCKEDELVYLAGSTPMVDVQIKGEETIESFVRGTEFYLDKEYEETAIIYHEIDGKRQKYEVDRSSIVYDYNRIIQEKEITVSLAHNLRKDRDENISDTYVKKGEPLEIIGCNMSRDFNEDGTVDGYLVKKEGQTYYLDIFYTQEETLDKSKMSYSTDFDYWYGEGYSKKTYIDDLTYLPVDRSEFEGKPFNDAVNAVHVGMTVAQDDQDYLIQLCQETGLNALVIELKSDNGYLMFESEAANKVYQEKFGLMTKEEFKTLIQKFKNAGIYVIGRMVTFKDSRYATAFPEDAIQEMDGSLLIHNGEPWPSPYSRDVWRYVLSFAKEAVELGVDEIQFDYCRFPDGLYEDEMNYQNQYNESKAQAITHFLYYAREELRKVEGYLSVDVFGWNMICGDDQDIGQFIPAIANIVDAISPMPYPDHFSTSIYGITQPWQEPGRLLEEFTKASMVVLNQIENPADYRSWIQGYACLSWVCSGTQDNPSRSYGASDVRDQIEGIRKAGEDGYIVWSGDGSQGMFDFRKEGFIE